MDVKNLNVSLVFLVLLSVFPVASRAVSFDCDSKDLNDTEIAICEDEELGDRDDYLADAYDQIWELGAEKFGGLEAFQNSQQAWVRDRNERCGADIECIKETYDERTEEYGLLSTRQISEQIFAPGGYWTKNCDRPNVYITHSVILRNYRGEMRPHVISRVPCWQAQISYGSLWLTHRMSDDDIPSELKLVRFVNPVIYTKGGGFTLTGMRIDNILTEGDFDETTQKFRNHIKKSDTDDAHEGGVWAYTGSGAVLEFYEYDGAKDGEVNPVTIFERAEFDFPVPADQ